METKKFVSEDASDAKSWIALSQIQGLSNAALCQLLAKFGSPANIFSTHLQQLKEIVGDAIASKITQGIMLETIQPTLDWLQKDNNHLITLADVTYPQALLQISNPPAVLYAIGHLPWLNHPAIAIVGSRNATPQGERNSENFAENLCNQGLCVVSGMALGIDGAAHRGALPSNGATIAVVGTGLDIVYPAKHRALAHQIAERGLILSEFPLGTPSKAGNFPRRNRLISGLSLGCLVVEANIDSGSMITARLATEQGREVFAIPSSIHSPVSKGCQPLMPTAPSSTSVNNGEIPSEADALLNIMGFEAISFETLLELSGLTTEALSSMLMILELEGKVTTLAGGNYQRLIE